ncbi:MAG TPA: S8 family serine peptidase, partial [Nocardioides sp.]
MKRGLIGCALGAALILPALSTLPASADQVASGEDLYILTSQDAGTAAYDGPLSTADYRRTLVAEQDATLASLGIDKPVYRWTTALSGVAVELDTGDAVRASRMEGWSVEKDTVRLLAGASSDPTSAPTGSASTATPSAGQGTVIGFVDTGISPDSPAFASTPSLGEQPRRFRGPCQAGEGWTARDCDNKVSGARWFVKGFGEDQLRSGASLSPRDDHGHGTQVASVAAGNADVTALAGNENLGTFSGTAPGARIAAYKACWTAPDPADDGCSTADVVSAVDRAVRDRVDVLNLSIAGEQGFDVVDRATLGAAEADIVVTAAAGNTDAPTGNEQPWMTTVGAASGRDLGGQLRLPDGSAITGVLTSPTLPRAARLVRAADAPAPGHTRQQA